MSYIQNKLDEFDKRFIGSPTDDDNYQSEYEVEHTNDIRKFIEQSFTDYHNHIAKQLRCRECNGSGAYSTPSDYGPCSYCDGTGLRPDGSLNDLLQDTNLKE